MAFLERKKTSIKCNKCLVNKKCTISLKSENVIIDKKGTGDILFVLEMPERDIFYSYFKRWIQKNGINNYQIAVGLKCQTNNFDIPSPMYSCFKNCNTISKDIDCKVIVTVGRSISAITHSDDLISWREVAEYKFNKTYFYTPLSWNKKLRVYPIPALYDWVKEKTNFESFFALFQINEIKKLLVNYELEKVEPYEIKVIDNPNEFLLKEEFKDKKIMAWDLETTHLDHFADDFRVLCMSLSFDGKVGYSFPMDQINKRILSSFFLDKKGILANGKFDLKALYLLGIRNARMDEDVNLSFHILNTQRMSNSIKALAWLIGFGGYQDELETYIKKYKIKKYSEIPSSILYPYATMDSIVTYKLYEESLKYAELQPAVFKAYKDYVIPSIPAYLQMELEGIQLDMNYLNELSNKLKLDIGKLEKEVMSHFDSQFDLCSNQQLAKVMEINKWPCLGRSKKQSYTIQDKKGRDKKIYYYSVGDEQLVSWEREGYKIATKIKEHRTLTKLLTSFVGSVIDESEINFFKKDGIEKEEGLVKFIKSDGKLHPTYNPGRTDSVRSSANAPNPQQFPKQGAEGKIFRPIIVCPDDYYIMEVDYSGFQLRIAAILSEDKTMKDIFLNKGGDMHSVTAQSVFCRDLSVEEFLGNKKNEPYKSYRFKAKGVNFGFIFGLSAYSFAKVLYAEWDFSEIENYIKSNELTIIDNQGVPEYYLTVAEDIRDKFFKTYPSLLPWIKSCHDFAEKNGYVESWHGIRRHLPTITHKGYDYRPKEVSNLLNISVNSPVQSFEACEAYKGMSKIFIKVQQLGLKSKFFSMVHDSLVFYVPKNEVKDMYYICKDCMEDYTTWDIPILIDVAVGKIWGFGEEIENEKELDKFTV